MRMSKFAILLLFALLPICATGCKRDDVMTVLSGADSLRILLSIQKDGLECGLESLSLFYNLDGRPIIIEPFPVCDDGVAMGGFAILQRDAVLRFLTVCSTLGLFSKVQKLYSIRSPEPRSRPPKNAIPAEEFFATYAEDKPDGLTITFTTHDNDWHTYYVVFVPMGAEGMVLVEKLSESLDGEARELMLRLMMRFDGSGR